MQTSEASLYCQTDDFINCADSVGSCNMSTARSAVMPSQVCVILSATKHGAVVETGDQS